MPSACGIACEVCGGRAKGTCPIGGCVPGTQAADKLEAQRKILGFTCPILECALKHGVDHCSRDCPDFPCEKYYQMEIPYSKKFLDILKKVLKH
ncbi:MAG: hypothetical protein DRJ98_08670 [Thermoprotei archaeon]|nr:MAG: hypothetical protein DRJ98_08670 [Thermoprotei archaeon]RLF16977.1 MAG: hypothetical protein DRN06_04540 [Thermoprotei archaeon]